MKKAQLKTEGANSKAVRQSNKENNQALKVTKEAVFLKEGVTGKMRRQAKQDTGKLIKMERASYTDSVNAIFKHGSEWIAQVNMSKTAFKKQYTPRDIKNKMSLLELSWAVNALLNEKKGFINFTPHLIMTCFDRNINLEKDNKYAVEFFDLLDSNDTKKFDSCCARILKARAKQLADKKAKADAKK